MYVLPEKLRPQLAKPLAPPLATADAVAAVRGKPFIASVGDVVTEMLLDHGIRPQLAIVDFRTKREAPSFDAPLRRKLDEAHYVRERFQNPAATITQVLWDAVSAAVRRAEPTALEIVGEEDLAVLPVVLLAPDGAAVLYGQPNEGAVVLTVNAEARQRVRILIDQMEKR